MATQETRQLLRRIPVADGEYAADSVCSVLKTLDALGVPLEDVFDTELLLDAGLDPRSLEEYNRDVGYLLCVAHRKHVRPAELLHSYRTTCRRSGRGRRR